MPRIKVVDPDLDARIGTVIKRFRKTLGLTQNDVAVASGITFQQMQKYEAGTNRISASRLITVAETLGVTPATIVAEVQAETANSAKPLTRTGPLVSAGASQSGMPEDDEDAQQQTLDLVRAFWDIQDDGLRRTLLSLIVRTSGMNKRGKAGADDIAEDDDTD
jgi:transcriptional regulator with XRE-family HTH domain